MQVTPAGMGRWAVDGQWMGSGWAIGAWAEAFTGSSPPALNKAILLRGGVRHRRLLHQAALDDEAR